MESLGSVPDRETRDWKASEGGEKARCVESSGSVRKAGTRGGERRWIDKGTPVAERVDEREIQASVYPRGGAWFGDGSVLSSVSRAFFLVFLVTAPSFFFLVLVPTVLHHLSLPRFVFPCFCPSSFLHYVLRQRQGGFFVEVTPCLFVCL